jgi:hypothetical protein
MPIRESYIKNIANLSIEDIVKGIRLKHVTFRDLVDTGSFSNSKQKQVKKKLASFDEEDNAFNSATTLLLLKEFLKNFPRSVYYDKVQEKINQKEAEEREQQKIKFDVVKNNINDYRPDEVRNDLGEVSLRKLCDDLGIDYNVVVNYDEPPLSFNQIPQNSDDIPIGFTDVFFWGIPSSGKTTALAAILRTMKDKYTITNPSISTKFGATYRDSLINIFDNKTAYLPASTQKDRTQYMPFLLKRRNEANYRHISFFELSGEVFKYFYELENSYDILDEDDREHVESAFNTLKLLLKSDNQKIHFFFIDYKQETNGIRDKHNLTQENYLNAATTYFRDNLNIFSKKTDAVYVVVTKADEIKGGNITELAKDFLSTNFGGFMDLLIHRCKNDSVEFNVKVFSIGDVYFKGICKLNYYYAENVIENLLEKVRPTSENRFTKWLNS